MRYEIRMFESRWTVIDRGTGSPATIGGQLQEGLSKEEADDVADLLNEMDRERDHRLDEKPTA